PAVARRRPLQMATSTGRAAHFCCSQLLAAPRQTCRYAAVALPLLSRGCNGPLARTNKGDFDEAIVVGGCSLAGSSCRRRAAGGGAALRAPRARLRALRQRAVVPPAPRDVHAGRRLGLLR